MAKAKKRNDGPGRPAIAITDENLKDFSAGGQVFVLETGTPEDATVPEGAVPAPEAAVAEPVTEAPVPGKIEGREGSESDRELFWRQSVSELRTGLAPQPGRSAANRARRAPCCASSSIRSPILSSATARSSRAGIGPSIS